MQLRPACARAIFTVSVPLISSACCKQLCCVRPQGRATGPLNSSRWPERAFAWNGPSKRHPRPSPLPASGLRRERRDELEACWWEEEAALHSKDSVQGRRTQDGSGSSGGAAGDAGAEADDGGAFTAAFVDPGPDTSGWAYFMGGCSSGGWVSSCGRRLPDGERAGPLRNCATSRARLCSACSTRQLQSCRHAITNLGALDPSPHALVLWDLSTPCRARARGAGAVGRL